MPRVSRDGLRTAYDDVLRARADVVRARRVRAKAGPLSSTGARQSLRVALEAYAAMLTMAGAPTPPQIRDELRMMCILADDH